MTQLRSTTIRVRRGQRAGDTDRGSVSVFLAISVVGLLLIIGLIGDGGVKIRAAREADAVAAEAARAAGQAIDTAAAVGGSAIQVDRRAAVAAAQSYLASAGRPGTVAVSDDRRTITVTVTITRPTVFLSLIGITQVTSTGTAHATLVHSVTGGTP